MGLWNQPEVLRFPALANATSAAFNLRGGSYVVETASRMSGLFTAATNATSTQVVVIGSITYRIMTTPVAANDIQLGGTAAATLANIIATLNGTGTIGAAGGTNCAFTGTVSPAVAARAAPQTATNITNKSVTIYSVVAGPTGNLTSTTTITAATWTAAALAITSTTIDLQRLSADQT